MTKRNRLHPSLLSANYAPCLPSPDTQQPQIPKVPKVPPHPAIAPGIANVFKRSAVQLGVTRVREAARSQQLLFKLDKVEACRV